MPNMSESHQNRLLFIFGKRKNGAKMGRIDSVNSENEEKPCNYRAFDD